MKRQREEAKEAKEIKEVKHTNPEKVNSRPPEYELISLTSPNSQELSQSFSKEHSNLMMDDFTYDLTWNSQQEQVTQQLPTQLRSLSVSSLPTSFPVISAPSQLVDSSQSSPLVDPSLSMIQSRSLVDSSLPIIQSPTLLVDDADFGLPKKQMDFPNDLVSTSRESMRSSTKDSLYDFEDCESIGCDDFPESGIWDTFYSETTPNISAQGYS